MIPCFPTVRLNSSLIRFMKNGLPFLVLTLLVIPATGTIKKSPFGYCGGWLGQHSGSNRIGKGTAELIAPSWAITAAHVAKPKATNPGQRHVQINFGGHKAGVVKAYVAPQGDLALVRLKTPMNAWPKVALLDKPLTKKDGVIKFTLVGHSGGLHFHRDRRARGMGLNARHVTTKKDNPGKAGDSGGAWVIERKDQHVLLAVIHGGGVGTQPAALRKWIDQTMKKSGEKANWVALKKPKK
jgi:hypothetical protein